MHNPQCSSGILRGGESSASIYSLDPVFVSSNKTRVTLGRSEAVVTQCEAGEKVLASYS
jgi:hypothetical protein